MRGTFSRISDDVNDGIEVGVISIDDFACDNSVIPNYIKMDVEGFESAVLEGAKNTIIKTRPTLAVSVYHKVEHLVELPLMLSHWADNYSFYLRHYTQGYSETVLFAVPLSTS